MSETKLRLLKKELEKIQSIVEIIQFKKKL